MVVNFLILGFSTRKRDRGTTKRAEERAFTDFPCRAATGVAEATRDMACFRLQKLLTAASISFTTPVRGGLGYGPSKPLLPL